MVISEKFFHEAGDDFHYDARFYQGKVDPCTCQETILKAVDAFSSICNRAKVQPILMHGALIGWYWNKRLLPWDDDIDFCVEYNDLLKLKLILQTPEVCYDKKNYLFEINPNYKNRATLNRNHWDWKEPNKIDARFIDKKNGLFIDITALFPIDNKQLATKCPHVYQISDIFPLRKSTLEGKKVYVPYNVSRVLTQEYGEGALHNKVFQNFFFNSKDKEWQRINQSVF